VDEEDSNVYGKRRLAVGFWVKHGGTTGAGLGFTKGFGVRIEDLESTECG